MGYFSLQTVLSTDDVAWTVSVCMCWKFLGSSLSRSLSLSPCLSLSLSPWEIKSHVVIECVGRCVCVWIVWCGTRWRWRLRDFIVIRDPALTSTCLSTSTTLSRMYIQLHYTHWVQCICMSCKLRKWLASEKRWMKIAWACPSVLLVDLWPYMPLQSGT